jgi:HlyD family secretion protein
MRKTRIAVVTAILAGVVVAAFAFGVRARDKNDRPQWKTARVVRADVRATVTATGTLQPVVTSPVGAQVSGIV